jgi:hypothetical protein
MERRAKTASISQLKSDEYDVVYSHGAIILPVNSTDVEGSLPSTRQSEKDQEGLQAHEKDVELVEDEA